MDIFLKFVTFHFVYEYNLILNVNIFKIKNDLLEYRWNNLPYIIL